MRRLLLSGLLLALLAFVFLQRTERGASPASSPALQAPLPPPPPAAGRPAEEVDARWLDLARGFMDRPRQGHCGPYRWLGDVDDARLLASCQLLAAELDAVYARRFGLEPLSPPAATLFLFADLSAFRRFVAADPWISGAHAGYASAARGFVALYVDEQATETVLATLTHELTHLVHRRVLGTDLPPWLSEGLADAIGDSATASGFRPLPDRAGDGVQAWRLREARRDRRTRPLADLVALERQDFDRPAEGSAVSFDYEESALLVRFLLSDPDLATAFRRYLKRLAAGESYDPLELSRELGQDWSRLEEAFYGWLEDPRRGRDP